METIAKETIIKILREEFGIGSTADIYALAEEDAALLYEKLKPVQEEYNLPEDDMENILEEILAEL